MDGYAVRGADVAQAPVTLKLIGEVVRLPSPRGRSRAELPGLAQARCAGGAGQSCHPIMAAGRVPQVSGE